jgi:hypothetical protein
MLLLILYWSRKEQKIKFFTDTDIPEKREEEIQSIRRMNWRPPTNAGVFNAMAPDPSIA